MKDSTKKWIKAAGVRALKTFAQTAAGGILVGRPASETDWISVFSVALVAGIASILTSLGGLPEVK